MIRTIQWDMLLPQIALIYLVIINIITFIIYGVDKRKAEKHKWRIPEIQLIGLAAIGGSLGALSAMNVFRHKTKHIKFYAGVPTIMILQIAAMIFVIIKY